MRALFEDIVGSAVRANDKPKPVADSTEYLLKLLVKQVANMQHDLSLLRTQNEQLRASFQMLRDAQLIISNPQFITDPRHTHSINPFPSAVCNNTDLVFQQYQGYTPLYLPT